jgi:protein-disulfide isomerase
MSASSHFGTRVPRWTVMLVVAAASVLLAGACASAQPKDSVKGAPAAAKVGDEVISMEEVERAAATPLAKLEEQRYAVLDEKLQQLIGQRVLTQEAKQRGMSIEDLLKLEVYGKAPDVPDADVTTFIAQNQARLPQGGDEAGLRLKVWDYLRSQKVNERREAYIQDLRRRRTVAVFLEAPVGSRAAVGLGSGFVRGPDDAPVTIVEFSDFDCPFCKNVVATVKEVLGKYPKQVRWVFRDFPLAALHPGAPQAHEAARCAAEQGKFWEYHDVLFQQSAKGPERLKQYAKDLSLDAPTFAQCLDSGKHKAAVSRDLEEGTRLGVTGTPTFFVNGRLLVGAQPLTAFQKIIESELTRKPTP